MPAVLFPDWVSDETLRVPVQATREVRVILFVERNDDVDIRAVLATLGVRPSRENLILGARILTDKPAQVTEPMGGQPERVCPFLE